MSKDPIVVTGFGIISSLGNDSIATLSALRNGIGGIGNIQHLQTTHTEFPVGEVKMSNEEMASKLKLHKETVTTRTALMGMIALDEAISMSGINNAVNDNNIAFVSGTTVGGMDRSEQHYLDFLKGDKFKEYIATHDCGACTEMIASRHDMFNIVATPSTACSSAANALILGANLILSNQCDVAIAGGSECITKFHLNGFNALMILDRHQCRPFDDLRAGLNLGEGAAYLVLERYSHAIARNATPLVELSGWSNTCDAFHQTASSENGDGAYLAMKNAIEMAKLSPTKIDYINAHGTGTPNNDLSETRAMQRLFGNDIPPVSSTKSSTGHTTSASGAIESVITILAMLNDFIPANLGWENPIANGIIPVSRPILNHKLNHALCNSFGFGGNDSSLLFSKISNHEVGIKYTEKPVYINGAAQISIQQPLANEWITTPIVYDNAYNESIDPDFRKWMSPGEARRLGKIMKRAVSTSAECINQSGIHSPDAIITATGLGCVKNTELFLTDMCTNGEALLKPTQFMQSTHNTIGSLIAILNKCHSYNVTYAHRDISTEVALLDAVTQIETSQISNALVGAHDEITPNYYTLLERIGYYGQQGMVTAGETAVSLMLSDSLSSNSLCKIDSVRVCYNFTNEQIISILNSLQSDAILAGFNGRESDDIYYNRIINQSVGKDSLVLKYKNIFGESMTASALGIYAAANILHTQQFPVSMIVKGTKSTKLNSIVCLNIREQDCAIVKLSTCY